MISHCNCTSGRGEILMYLYCNIVIPHCICYICFCDTLMSHRNCTNGKEQYLCSCTCGIEISHCNFTGSNIKSCCICYCVIVIPHCIYTSDKVRACCMLLWHCIILPGRVAQWVGHMTRKSGVLGSIPGLATYFHFSFRFFKKGSCQLLAKVCAQSTG